MMVLRLPIATLFGAVISAGLFYLLWGFVGSPLEYKSATQLVRLPTVRIDTPALTKDSKQRVKPEQKEQPNVPKLPGLDIERPVLVMGRPPSGTPGFPRKGFGDAIGHGIGPGGSDGDATPLVRILPQYPPHLRGKNVEGWVRVRFTVAVDGTVKDAQVVAAEPAKEFDSAALAAVARWRYRPRVDGGTPVERVGLETILRFELED